MKTTKNEKGITLIALIITIIILVIISAVAIAEVMNTNIVKLAIKGTENYIEAEAKEKEELDIVEGTVSRIELTSPGINIIGDTNEGYNGYYISDVEIVISGKGTSANKIRCVVTGAEEHDKTEEVNKNSEVKLTVQTEGKYTVKAYSVDSYENQSVLSDTKSFTIDKEGPVIVGEVTSKGISETEAEITANASDNMSGIVRIQILYR